MDILVNGIHYEAKQEMSLLRFLRDVLHLEGTKDGCSEGACGACTVIIDGKAQRACVQKLSRLEGRSIITIEGLSEKEKEVYSYSFAKAGAVQCGYCTPGMILSAKALIDINSSPSLDDVKKAIRGNICRCTGYKKIEEAILMAARIFRGEEEIDGKKESAYLGMRYTRLDAIEKALGKGVFVNDMEIDGVAHLAIIRSPYPKCLIKKIDTSELEEDPRCIGIIRKKDVPFNRHGHLTPDWPVLYGEGDITSYIGDALLIIASHDKTAIDELRSLVKIEAEPIEGVYSAEDALKDERIVHYWEKTNLYREENIIRGDADEAIRNAEHVITRTYTTPHTEHAFMEPEAAIAIPEEGIIHLYTSSQSVYDDRRECARMLQIPEDKVRVTACLVGGGFGGKEDMSVQHHAALAAYILKCPVKLVFSRQESLNVHPKRHPMRMELTLACDKNGKIMALKEDILADTGAYASLGGPVLQRACTHAGGPYNYQNMKVRGRALYTNNVPSGAFRGFGVTQTCFAIESALDEMASIIGMDPFRIREINVIKPGEELPNGQIAGADTAAYECLMALKEDYYNAKYKGIALGFKNAGLGMGVPDAGRCIISVEKGKIHIRTSAACMGQGLKTMALQVAVETTDIDPELFIIEEPDTARTPDSGTSTASRQTAFTGEAVRLAAEELKKALEHKSLRDIEGLEIFKEFMPHTDPLGSDKKNPVSHLAYSYSAQMAVLTEDGMIDRIITSSDAGTVINKTMIEGQIEGGVATGMGYAVRENFITENGYVKSRYGTLGLLRSTEVPRIEVRLVHAEGKSPSTYGAKGIGELCAIPTAPAIRNAYLCYDGKKRYSLPLDDTPYRKKKD